MSLAIVRDEHPSVPPAQDPSHPEWLRAQALKFISELEPERLESIVIASVSRIGKSHTWAMSTRTPAVHEWLGIMESAKLDFMSPDATRVVPPTPETGPETT